MRFAPSFVALCLVASLAFAQEQKVEEGFTPLFNGKDLTGWTYGQTKPSGKGYQVENGVLFCTKADGGNLYTEKEYGDFAFRFEFKLSENSNNGVGIRTPPKGDAAYVGMEIQVLDDSGPAYKGKLAPYQFHGSIYGVAPAKTGHLKPTGEWNTQEIRAEGNRITITLNGEVIVDHTIDTTKPTIDKKQHPGLANKKGHIGFLGHGTRVEFRNMRIKELTAAGAN